MAKRSVYYYLRYSSITYSHYVGQSSFNKILGGGCLRFGK